MERFDIIIVGAGLAGLQCARLLKNSGLKVALIDRKAQVDQRVHTTGVFVRKTLQDYHFPPGSLGPPVSHVNLYSPKGKKLSLESKHEEFAVGDMKKIYRYFLNESIKGGMIWCPQYQLMDIQKFGRDLLLDCMTPTGKEQMRCRLVIGADGVHSKVARLINLSQNQEWIVGVEDVYQIQSKDLKNKKPSFHCYLEPHLAPGYLAWVIEDGKEIHVGVGGRDKNYQAKSALDIFSKRIERDFNLKQQIKPERRGGRIPVGGILNKISNPHGLLVGDAAGAVSPLTAGGLDPCMRLTEFAVQTLAKYFSCPERDPVHILAEYSGERFQSRFFSKKWMRNSFNQLQTSQSLEFAFSILKRKPFKKLAQHIFFGRGSFPDIPELKDWKPSFIKRRGCP